MMGAGRPLYVTRPWATVWERSIRVRVWLSAMDWTLCHTDPSAAPLGQEYSHNLSVAWVIMVTWVRSGLAAFGLSPIRTIIRRVMFTASLARRGRLSIFVWTEPLPRSEE